MTRFQESLRTQWPAAQRQISESEVVLFLGFGYSYSDEDMRGLDLREPCEPTVSA